MTGMDDLVTWLRAQLDEDEAEAREALRRQTTQRRMIRGQMMDVPNQPMPEWRRSVWPPARVLAEVDAKRRIIEAEQDRIVEEGPLPERLRDQVETDVIKLLALPYADRPGYREEWRP